MIAVKPSLSYDAICDCFSDSTVWLSLAVSENVLSIPSDESSS
ncbi:hypothetical protein RE474_00160 [Methanolobus sediminis]|uniref:Uncharacterized protein n=1 Tax=Methanolobus sediminis TaxID=3072978 RepID=A0AA51YJ30_9EURY|nr:hypothetical protein [Methanolobus sediminis]WMW25166.1 hypothetical protein RE474_00160 [Methanolobus sediminis]